MQRATWENNVSLIITETENSIGTIIMNHATKRNALSEALIDEVTITLDAFKEQNIRAVVLRAPSGAKVWIRLLEYSTWNIHPLPEIA